MTDLVTFTRARLAERENQAREAAAYGTGFNWSRLWSAVVETDGTDPDLINTGSAPTGLHIAANDPAYVLRDVAAKLRIVRDYEVYVHAIRGDDDPGGSLYAGKEAFESAVRSLASIWSDHPDYQQEWKLP